MTFWSYCVNKKHVNFSFLKEAHQTSARGAGQTVWVKRRWFAVSTLQTHGFLPLILSLQLPVPQSLRNRHRALQHPPGHGWTWECTHSASAYKSGLQNSQPCLCGSPHERKEARSAVLGKFLSPFHGVPSHWALFRLPCVVVIYLNQVSLKFAYLQQKSLQSLSLSMHVQFVQRGLWKLVCHISRGRFPCSFFLSVVAFQRRGEQVETEK